MKSSAIHIQWLAAFALSACSHPERNGANRSPDTAAIQTPAVKQDDGSHYLYLTDSTKLPFVRMVTKEWMIEWGDSNSAVRGSLDSLTQGQGFRMPPTVLWHTEEFICLMTNHTGPFSQHLLLPLKSELSPVFFREDVEYFDQVDNFACLIDTVYRDSLVRFEVQDFVTGHSESFELVMCDGLYPWHGGIKRQGDFLVIQPMCEREPTKRLNITKYRDDL